MQSDWILDVLADLRSFAMSNDLPALAEQLDDTALIALAEIAALEERRAKNPAGGSEKNRVGRNPRVFGAIGHA